MKDERLYLHHILEASDAVFEFAQCTEEQFLKDRMRRDAIIKNLANIAESTIKISPETKALRGDIPWESIAAFRHVLVHDYLGKLNHIRVWKVVKENFTRPEGRGAIYSGGKI